MQNFSNITIVSVTGCSNAGRAADALTLSWQQMPGARALLCSPHAPANLPAGIEHRKIAPLTYQEYSWFMMFALWRVIETDFALIVQDDGWVLDANNWSDEFLDYDYVGPPTHVGRIDTQDRTQWVVHHKWGLELDQPGKRVMPVLNGGFCLRSRRMMRVFADHPEIMVRIPPPDSVGGDSLKMTWVNGAPNEDVQLTAILRPELEAVGIRFAPAELCARFGMENAGYLHRNFNTMTLFGHHCSWRRLVSIDPPTVQFQIRLSAVMKKHGERAFARMLQERGYRLRFVPE
ncbi:MULTISPECIES: DUF5672 family protein [Caballeronia]|uniref:DUF5672 family protein n=1 Tax=Caballeronia TaxID=1827195 RepID=UPI00029BFF8A|nr:MULTISPECIES: DUF5672 family protein [Caballeronia]EKS72921.1 glycosyl transferase family protein [Burkholderia sp. SJ98]MCG7404447.1 glycosyl transferase family 17 [Caballeronia zhejiangensis]MDR5765592.1 DUF5672 family protein [Caballeronia sp. LZ028]